MPAEVLFGRLFAVVAAVAASFAAVFTALAVITALAIFTLAIRVVTFSHLVSPVKFTDSLNIMRKQRFVNRLKRGHVAGAVRSGKIGLYIMRGLLYSKNRQRLL